MTLPAIETAQSTAHPGSIMLDELLAEAETPALINELVFRMEDSDPLFFIPNSALMFVRAAINAELADRGLCALPH
jgi:hypothetical protein